MRIRLMIAVLAVLMCSAVADGGVRRIWVVNDGEKVERDALNHPAAARNSAWDGHVARIFGARNEIVAFQGIVEGDARGVNALSLRLPELASRRKAEATRKAEAKGSSDRIVY